jgi:hypothetical protein
MLLCRAIEHFTLPIYPRETSSSGGREEGWVMVLPGWEAQPSVDEL